jgi:hypothetical protein
MANIVTNPSANQQILDYDLIPATGNTTQSLGDSTALWDAALGSATSGALNNIVHVDGVVYPFTQAGVQAAIDAATNSGSSTLGALTVTYTDPDGTELTLIGSVPFGTSVITQNSGNTASSLLIGIPLLLNCQASTEIQYAFAYASGGATPMEYNLHVVLEAL